MSLWTKHDQPFIPAFQAGAEAEGGVLGQTGMGWLGKKRCEPSGGCQIPDTPRLWNWPVYHSLLPRSFWQEMPQIGTESVEADLSFPVWALSLASGNKSSQRQQ